MHSVLNLTFQMYFGDYSRSEYMYAHFLIVCNILWWKGYTLVSCLWALRWVPYQGPCACITLLDIGKFLLREFKND